MQAIGLKRETFFEGILQHAIPEYDVKLPIFYYDNTSMTAIYTAPTSKMRAHLPSDALHPVEIYPGRCLAALSAFEYRKTDIGPYNEFSLATLVTYGRPGLAGLSLAKAMLTNEVHVYILSLPVDSEVARRGGCGARRLSKIHGRYYLDFGRSFLVLPGGDPGEAPCPGDGPETCNIQRPPHAYDHLYEAAGLSA